MADNRKINHNPDLIKRILKMLEVGYKKLDKTTYRPNNISKTMVELKLSGTTWTSLIDLNIIHSIGKQNRQSIWIGEAPSLQMAEVVYAKAKANATKKFKPLTTRKQHNPGTLFIALQTVYDKTQKYTYFSAVSFIKVYELAADIFQKIATLGYCEEYKGDYRWLKQPDQDLADVLYQEIYRGQKRNTAEMHDSILKLIIELKRLYGSVAVMEGEKVTGLFNTFNLPPKYQARIRKAFLMRIPALEAEERGVKIEVNNYKHYLVLKPTVPPANLNTAVSIHKGKDLLVAASPQNVPDPETQPHITVTMDAPINGIQDAIIKEVTTLLNQRKITGYRLKENKLIIHLN